MTGNEFVRLFRQPLRFLLLLSNLCFLSTSAANAATRLLGEVEPIFLSGKSAPGTNGASFLRLDQFKINRQGSVALIAELAPGGSVDDHNDGGVWTNTHGDLALVARTGDPALGGPAGVQYIRFEEIELNNPGDVAFHAHWTGSGNDRNEGIWKTGPGGLQLVARTDVAAPGVVPVRETGGVYFPTFNDAGDVGYAGVAGMAGGAGAQANWFSKNGIITLAAISGAPSPGMPAGSWLNGIGPSPFATHQRNLILIGTLNSSSDRGVWRFSDGRLSPLILPTTPAPGVPADKQLSIATLSINRQEDLAFTAYVRGGSTQPLGLWRMRGGAIDAVVQPGQTAPGGPNGAGFEFVFSPQINDRGDVVFDAGLALGPGVTLANRGGIWYTDEGELKYLFRYGDSAPGTATGTKFGNGQFAGSPSYHALNNRGQIAFFSHLQFGTGDVTQANDAGIWASDTGGDLQLVARRGDLIEVASGDFRTIDRVLSTFQLSERGEVVFLATFTDGSQSLLTSTRVAVLDGDFNYDHVVDAADYTVWRDRFGTDEPAADANFDRIVNASDYQIWKQNFGRSRAPLTISSPSVPEPGCGAICGGLVGVMGCAVRRIQRRRRV